LIELLLENLIMGKQYVISGEESRDGGLIEMKMKKTEK